MASTVNEIAAQASENLTEYQNTTTARVPSTPEGMAIAYGSLIIMAILPIFFGSYRAVKHHKEQQVSSTRVVTYVIECAFLQNSCYPRHCDHSHHNHSIETCDFSNSAQRTTLFPEALNVLHPDHSC